MISVWSLWELEIESCGPWDYPLCLYNETPINTLTTQSSDEVPWVVIPGGWCSLRIQMLCIWDPPRPCSMGLLFGWFWFVCFCCNKTVIAGVVLSWVLGVTAANYWTWEYSRSPWICIQLVRSIGGLGTPSLWLISEVRVVLWRTMPLTCEDRPNSGQLAPEFHYREEPLFPNKKAKAHYEKDLCPSFSALLSSSCLGCGDYAWCCSSHFVTMKTKPHTKGDRAGN